MARLVKGKMKKNKDGVWNLSEYRFLPNGTVVASAKHIKGTRRARK